MARIRIAVVGEDATNSYVISSDGACVVIDPGAPDPSIVTLIREVAPASVTILLTHSHWDHFLGVDFLLSEFPGSLVFVSAADRDGLFDPTLNLSDHFPEKVNLRAMDCVRILSEGDQVQCGAVVIDVLETPGHTRGGLTFVIESEKAIFTGDTLFRGSVGLDCPDGMMEILKASIRDKIFTFPDEFRVFPGHYGSTTVGERAADGLEVESGCA
jgi:hydroxyacylglutathione hydrolase